MVVAWMRMLRKRSGKYNPSFIIYGGDFYIVFDGLSKRQNYLILFGLFIRAYSLNFLSLDSIEEKNNQAFRNIAS